MNFSFHGSDLYYMFKIKSNRPIFQNEETGECTIFIHRDQKRFCLLLTLMAFREEAAL